jgi:hypothetical protein
MENPMSDLPNMLEEWQEVLDSDDDNDGKMSWQDFILALQEAYEAIPEQYRKSVIVRVDGCEGAGLSLEYMRPETDAEIKERLHNLDEMRRIRENHERERRVQERERRMG